MMSTQKWLRIVITLAVISQLLITYGAPAQVASAEVSSGKELLADQPRLSSPTLTTVMAAGAPVQGEGKLLDDTTLSVSILSSPWAILDSNDPGGNNGPVPQVFVVEGQVTNVGALPATNVVFTLDYNEDPANDWILLPGEDPERTIDSLAPGEEYHAYWFARYALVPNSPHQYSISAVADNAPLVSTSDNFYGNPQPGYTVETISYLSTGNSGIGGITSDIIVGVEFTVTVAYDLGTNPLNLVFSPVGNTTFTPAGYRFSAASVLFYNDARTWQDTVVDRLYFPTLDTRAQNAQVTFTFLDLLPEPTDICPYGGVDYSSTQKYDQFYCDPNHGTVLPLDGTLTYTMNKRVSSDTIEQGEVLTYTIDYTNTGSLPLSYVWIWDDINTSLGSVITPTISPPPDPAETSSNRVAWYLDHVPASGQPGSSGMLTFSILVDGAGQDIADQTALINTANFGINPGSLPNDPALTASVTTTLQAPTISAYKTDGVDYSEPGDLLNYTLQASNSGSVMAIGVVITDVLPSELTLDGTPTPPPDAQDGQTLVWTSLGPIAPDGSVSINVPVRVNNKTPIGTYLINNMAVEYKNPIGHLYAVQTAFDTTTVTAPLFTISKSAYPDPVFVSQPIVYTIVYANIGTSGATNTVITDTVPMSTTYQACSGAPCSISGGVVTWQVGSVPENSNGTVGFTVVVEGSLPKGSVIYNDHYGIISDQTYFLGGAPVTTPVKMLADVTIDKSSTPNPVTAGEILTYTLDLSDQGPSIAENIIVTDVLPSNVTFNSVISQPPSFSGPVQVGQTLTWTAPVLSAGENGAIIFTVLVDPDAIDPLTNIAGISSTTADLALGNNQDIEHTLISSPDLANIYGWVYEDTNGNEVKDPAETGILDVVITMDGVVTSTTALDGWYYFITDQAGDHSLVETDPAGYISTTPNEVQVLVSLGNSYRVDYGDYPLCTCPPDSFENDDSQAEAKPISVGLAGLQERTFCDDASDWITFTVEAKGVYTITTDAYGQRADTFLALYDRDGETLLAANDDYRGSPDYSSQIVWQARDSGVYYLHVTNRAGLTCCQTNYRVWVLEEPQTNLNYFLPMVNKSNQNRSDGITELPLMNPEGVIYHLCPDTYEVDDTWEQATLIVPGELQVHSFDSNPLIYSADKDVVGFNVSANDVVTFTVAVTNTQTLIELFDENGNSLGITGTTQIVWEAPEAGHYYLSVSPVMETFGCSVEVGYHLRMEISILPRIYLPLITR
jgi:uncharacterized repeat protein (TIGR01451 family)